MKVATSTERLNELFDSDARNDTAIAKSLNVSKQTISAWRNGSRSPKKSMVIKISEVFHVSIEWLLGFDVDRNPRPAGSIYIPDSDLFRRIVMHMSPLDYEVMMDIFQRTEEKMRQMGEL